MKHRIEQLRQKIREATGENPIFGGSPNCPPELEEAFLEKVLAFETSPRRVLFDLLQEMGIHLPKPVELKGEQLTLKLWEVINALLARYIVISNTDHLDNRELYTLLWNETLRQEFVISQHHTLHIDMTRTGPDDGMPVYLKYYATEEQRRLIMKHNPGFKMPEHVEPPPRRDHLIPEDPSNPD
jgi:hypothetical protein